MKTKYKLMLAIITISIGICLMTYQSYALWVVKFEGGENIVEVGCFDTSFTELTSPISLRNTYPMSDMKGMSGESYQFTIKNTCTIDASYEVTLNTLTTNTISKDKIKYAIYKSSDDKPTEGTLITSSEINSDKENISIPNLEESYIIGKENIKQNESVTYYFYMWIDNGAGNEAMEKTFEASIHVITAATTIVPPTAVETIIDLAKTDTINLAYDNTVDNNIRYIGKDPNNYVTFNNELWRIIGVMNNVEDESGTKVPRIKLIKSESIGRYSWDNKASGTGSSTSEWGSNDWSDSTLQEVLNNGAYYNRTSGTCPYGKNGATTACDFTSNGLTPEAKTMIENVKWKLGGHNTSSVTTPVIYDKERGTTVYSGRPTEWKGYVGLMYSSDYGYATSGGATTNREACLAKELYNWDATAVSDCKNNDWLYSSSDQWTLSPTSGGSGGVFYVVNAGYVGSHTSAYGTYGVSPAVYLLSETKISSGNGTKLAPYTLTVG